MRFKAPLLMVAAVLFFLPHAVSAQIDSPYYRRDDGYRGRPPPPPPPGYYEERRRYDDRRQDDRRYDDRRYRERDVYRAPRGIFCAREGGFCNFQGPATVRYGAAGRFSTRRAVNGIPCTNNVFGDPAVGLDKACYID
jgi:hypothetical protein